MKKQLIITGMFFSAFALIFTGIKKINSNGFYEHSRLADIALGSLSFAAFLLDLTNRFGNDTFGVFVSVLLVAVSIFFAYRLYQTLNQKKVTVYHVKSDDIFETLKEVLTKYRMEFDLEQDGSKKTMKLKDTKGQIKISNSEFHDNISDLEFKKIYSIPFVNEILLDIGELLAAKRIKISKWIGIGELVSGIGVFILGCIFIYIL